MSISHVRRALPALALLLAASPAAAVPLELVHQGRLIDGTTATPLEGVHQITFSVFDAPAGGSSVWVDTLDVNIDNGYYSVLLGKTAGNPLDVDAFDGAVWIQIGVDGGPGLAR